MEELSNRNDSLDRTSSPKSPQPQRKRNKADFTFKKHIGNGSYSSVYEAVEIRNNKSFAIKVLSKAQMVKEKKTKYVNQEKNILNKLIHPFVIKLYYTFHDEKSLYFVLELAEKGDILGFTRKMVSFDLDFARFYIAEILVGVEFIHSKGIIHRDLKPENILLDSNLHIKIADFGTAKDLSLETEVNGDQPHKKNSFVGTAEYCSPELLNDRAVSVKSDIWAIGCILYQLLCGRPPIKGVNDYFTFQKISAVEYSFPEGFPLEAENLIRSILVLDPKARPSIEVIKQHNFFHGFNWDNLHLQTPPKIKQRSDFDEFEMEFSNSDVEFEFSGPVVSENDVNDFVSDENLTDKFNNIALAEPTLSSIATSIEMKNTVAAVNNTTIDINSTSANLHITTEYDTNNNYIQTAKNPKSTSQESFFNLLYSNENLIKSGPVIKKSGFLNRKRIMVLTDCRIFFYNENNHNMKEEIILSNAIFNEGQESGKERKVNCNSTNSSYFKLISVEHKDSNTFNINTDKKCFIVHDPSCSARIWLDAINNLIYRT
ncbi:3-phosphoinositide dependent protein kinase-1 [Lobulomyces angularis]|nr:3-phosphoinositide dependent protein kinase-1 [Lobulomyces angularis]